jgi:hypothetical protein
MVLALAGDSTTTITNYAAGMLAMAVFAAQPCVAAIHSLEMRERRSAVFGGLRLNMPIGHGQQLKPTARLQLTSSHQFHDIRTGELRTFSPSGIELGAGRQGKPMLFLGGQEASEIQKKLGIGGTATTLLIVGGVVLVLLVIAAASTPPSVDFND